MELEQSVTTRKVGGSNSLGATNGETVRNKLGLASGTLQSDIIFTSSTVVCTGASNLKRIVLLLPITHDVV